MKELKDYFVTKEQAESLKELGFEEKCLASYAKNGELLFITSFHHIEINAPLIAQAIDWLTGELGVGVININSAIENLRLSKKKIQFTINLTFEVYQASKTYEDGNYLIIRENENYPVSICFAYGQMVDIDGVGFDDEDVSYISPSFEIIR
jgi:hypothetical protein